jgi:uncharacterized membrane protein YobD (UPF0266 family)
MKGKLLFKEEQQFRNTWMFYLIIGISLVLLAGVLVSLLNEDSITDGLVALAITIVVLGGVIGIFISSKLTITLDDKYIYYRFPPFVLKEQKLGNEDIQELFVRKYNPILEYGGWGYRVTFFRFRGKALNVAGNQGLQIIKFDNKRLLLGTQKPKEMEKAIQKLKENWGRNG